MGKVNWRSEADRQAEADAREQARFDRLAAIEEWRTQVAAANSVPELRTLILNDPRERPGPPDELPGPPEPEQ